MDTKSVWEYVCVKEEGLLRELVALCVCERAREMLASHNPLLEISLFLLLSRPSVPPQSPAPIGVAMETGLYQVAPC